MPPKVIREEKVGKSLLRLARDGDLYRGIVIPNGAKPSEPISGHDPDEVWKRLRNEVGKASPNYFGYEGAKSRFLSIMSEGFQTPWYLANERQYKLDAKSYLDERASLDRALQATAGDCVEIARAYSKTNVLSQFESARIHEILRGPNGVDFVRAAAGFTVGDAKGGLLMMNKIMAGHGQPSWPVATYLPFFWSPGRHMFLKPRVTRDFAERVGHAFAQDYSSSLEMPVYDSLLRLVAEAEGAIQDLAPRDRIDTQSFIWVVGGYTEKDAREVKENR